MKAILVMDMPENCMVCPLCNGSDECVMQDEDADFATDTVSELMNGCPLVPMPERKQNACSHGFAGGWNACLDAMEETGSTEQPVPWRSREAEEKPPILEG